MADNRTITCTNEDNVSAVFSRLSTPFILIDCDGIYEVTNNVSTSDNTMTDGATYQGSVAKMRNIVLTLQESKGADHRNNRDYLYTLFKPKTTGAFTYQEDTGTAIRQIEYYVESISVTTQYSSRTATVSLLCPDPYFVDPYDTIVSFAGWNALFEFEHEFVDGGEELAERTREKLAEIYNETATEDIGLTITITAVGDVTNPTVTHVEQGQSITIGTESKPFTMSYGEQVVITTYTNDKHVYSVIDGEQTEINQYLSEDSEFIQLTTGSNTIGYSADSGEDYMELSVSYRYRYAGA